jgi:hypothetical protein
MTLEELAAELPNGLHDSLLRSLSADGGDQRAEFILDVWIGDLHDAAAADRECRRPARLELLGLAYLVVDGPELRSQLEGRSPVQIDLCGADDNPARSRQVPVGGFAGRFFVTEWNSSIHFAAREARLIWIEVN